MTDGEQLGAPTELAAELERLRAGKPPPPFHALMATEEGRALYGDPIRGATLDQVWRLHVKLGGIEPICLFVPERVAAPTAITAVEAMSPNELVGIVIGILSRETEDQAIQSFVRGSFSHSVVLMASDGESVTYADPWPGKSLLARERGYFGVDVTEVASRRWRISRADLERVLYAVLLPPAKWARATGQPYRVSWAALKASDLFTFFHLREGSAQVEGRRTIYRVEQPRFAQYLNLAFTVDDDGTVAEAQLNLQQDWMRANSPLAMDLAKRFLAATLPPADREPARQMLEMLRALQHADGEAFQRLAKGELLNFASALGGKSLSANCVYPYSSVSCTPATYKDGMLLGWSAITVSSG